MDEQKSLPPATGLLGGLSELSGDLRHFFADSKSNSAIIRRFRQLLREAHEANLRIRAVAVPAYFLCGCRSWITLSGSAIKKKSWSKGLKSGGYKIDTCKKCIERQQSELLASMVIPLSEDQREKVRHLKGDREIWNFLYTAEKTRAKEQADFNQFCADLHRLAAE